MAHINNSGPTPCADQEGINGMTLSSNKPRWTGSDFLLIYVTRDMWSDSPLPLTNKAAD